MRIVSIIFSTLLFAGIFGGFTESIARADEQIVGVGGTYWSRTQAIGTTPTLVVQSAASGLGALFPAGDGADHFEKVSITTSTVVNFICAYTLTDSGISFSGLEIQDADGADGPGSAIVVAATGQNYDERPDWTMLKDIPGGKDGICADKVLISNELIYVPCKSGSDADCTPYAAGACSASPSRAQRAKVGAFQWCVADTTTGKVVVRKQRVRKKRR